MRMVKKVLRGIAELQFNLFATLGCPMVKAYCWDQLPTEKQEEIMANIVYLIENPRASPQELYAYGLQWSFEQGWRYDDAYDFTGKKSPSLVPWALVPDNKRIPYCHFVKTFRMIHAFIQEFPLMPECERPLEAMA